MSSAPAGEIDTQFNLLLPKLATLIVFSRYLSSASHVVTATGCSNSVVFPEILLGTCRSVTLVCSSLTSRDSLSCVIFLLLSDRDDLGCSALFSSALSSLITTTSPMSSLLLVPYVNGSANIVRGLYIATEQYFSFCGCASGLMLGVLDIMEVEVRNREQVEVRENVEARETEDEDKTRKQQTLRHVMTFG